MSAANEIGKKPQQVPQTHYAIADPAYPDTLLICAPIAIFGKDDKGLTVGDYDQQARESKVTAVKLPDFKTVYFSSGPVR